MDYKEKDLSWKKGDVILLDPQFALPYIGSHLTPLYSAIKSGLYKVSESPKPLIAKIIAEFSDDIVKKDQGGKKLLQNKLQAQILAKKAELAKNKNNS